MPLLLLLLVIDGALFFDGVDIVVVIFVDIFVDIVVDIIVVVVVVVVVVICIKTKPQKNVYMYIDS